MNKIILLIIFITIFIFGIICGMYACTYPFKPIKETLKWTKENRVKEKEYVNAYCNGQIEYRLPDKTRVDCLTDKYAIEFDFGNKWAESVGQSLYYAKKTGKKPAVALILKKEKDKKYINRIKTANSEITVFEIKAY